jgi:hypothetical protein
MNEEIARNAMKAIEKMAHVMSTQQKEHFASILTILTKCYGEDAKWRGTLLLADGEKFISVGINANEFEVAGLVSEAAVILNTEIKAEAPEHGMYN